MPRIRTIKPDYFQNRKVRKLSRDARYLFIAMLTQADDEGYVDDDPPVLRAAAFLTDEDLTDKNVSDMLERMEHVGLIRRLEVGEKGSPTMHTVWHITGFRKHQVISRATPSRYVLRPDDLFSEMGLMEDSMSTHGGSTGERKGREGNGTERNGTTPAVAGDAEFAAFWSAYPRKANKAQARKAWDKAVKRERAQVIIAAAVRYASDPNLPTGAESQFIPHGATWLNNDRWNDPPLPPRGGARPTALDAKRKQQMETVARYRAMEEQGETTREIGS
jgi:hypothetical protein